MEKIKILGELSYQTYPITEDMVEIDGNELNEIGKTKCFNFINKSIVDYVKPIDISNEIKKKISRLEELRKDFEQDRLGLIVPNLEERKEEYINLLQQIREIQNKEPRLKKVNQNFE